MYGLSVKREEQQRTNLLDENVQSDEIIAKKFARDTTDQLKCLSEQGCLSIFRIVMSTSIIDVHIDGINDIFD